MANFILTQKFTLKSLREQRQKIEAYFKRHENKLYKGKNFDGFVRGLWSLFPQKFRYSVLFSSVSYLAGVKLTPERLSALAWRLAGNQDRLINHARAVLPWKVQRYDEIVPAQIIDVKLARGGRRGLELGHDVTFKILGGTPCPQKIKQWWSFRRARFFATYKDKEVPGCFGFHSFPDKAENRVVFQDTKELYSLCCLLVISAELSDEEGPQFSKITHSAQTTLWNKTQLKYRKRGPGYECPHDMPESLYCFQCSKGMSSCRAAVHKQDYVLRQCVKCQEEQWHDETAGCVVCQEASVRVKEADV